MVLLRAVEQLCNTLVDKFGADDTEVIGIGRLLTQKVVTHENRKYLLEELSRLLLYEAYTLPIAECFSPVLFDILSHFSALPREESSENITIHECLTVALGKLIWLFPDAVKFAKSYFSKSRSIWARFDNQEIFGSPTKKRRKTSLTRPTLKNLLQAALQFLTYDLKYFQNLWDWHILVQLIQHKHTHVRWLAYRCLFHLGGIRQVHCNAIVRCFSDDDIGLLDRRDSMLLSHIEKYDLFKTYLPKPLPEEEWCQPQALEGFTESDFSPNVISISGVLLEKISDAYEDRNLDDFVSVPSMRQALHSLAMAVSSGKAILLQGPVGSGKTTLVEHLACLTGRKQQKDLLKIQLGDRMDSKLLVGSHHCTEVPGEFIWQPGLLTEAMICGHWLLLEDIDCAPMDVISLLVPVLQSSSIVLPGHANPVKAAAGFQLFATQRLLSGHDSSYVEFRSSAEILDKLWQKVTIFPMSRKELQQVISKKWPVLDPVLDRILEVYYMILSGGDSDECSQSHHSVHGGRLVSTRDLFKWCNRISSDFDIKSVETAISTFQDALDCFCQSIPNMNSRITLAEAIGGKFGIPSSKAEFFCKKYKPDICVAAKAVKVGRAQLNREETALTAIQRPYRSVFAHTRQSVALLEKVAVAVQNQEPVLLVGETGSGKTSVVQYLAHITNNNLIVVNMNQQSDSIDLLGGYKPVDLKLLIFPLKQEYEEIFCATFSEKQNVKFLGHIMNCFRARRWKALFSLMTHTQLSAVNRLNSRGQSSINKKLLKRWRKLGARVCQLQVQILQQENKLAFAFIEGTLVKAMREGKWLLLDEINLAEAETLECLGGVLEKHDDSLFLLEKGDKEPVIRHPNFRLFACMNPATDVGKKELPVGIRNRFTEFFMEELEEKSDLITLVDAYLHGLTLSGSVLENIVDFYVNMRKMALEKLTDGTGHHPHYSLRTLCRALSYAASNPCGCVPRSIFEAFSLSFLSQLDHSSHPTVKSAIVHYILGKKNQQSVLKQLIPEPPNGKYTNFEGYWIPCGNLEPQEPANYILTKSVKRNLKDLARIVSAGKYPVLLQGETSVGKTSLVQWLAQASGNHCVRVNNHEHTDIQEYIGSYCLDSNGQLVFKEGVLVEAMRNGYWIILDELNLAPTEVMEALNRVLDDNRELFITETQLTVKAHPRFLIFATQNPAGLYGGRKVLSRAFRNRFVELHFDQIPPDELEIILEQRCAMPASYCKKLIAVMQELQMRRRESGIFAGKQGYITLRDLFRWGERYRLASEPKQESKFYDWNQHLGEEGYMLLAGRVRRPEEAQVIKEVIEKHVKCKIDPLKLFAPGKDAAISTSELLEDIISKSLPDSFRHLVWTHNMRRLVVLVAKALEFNEPVLLIGDTGCGKTTVCQMLADLSGTILRTVNCHMHTESADFLGGLRPVRSQQDEEDSDSQKLFEWVEGSLVTAMRSGSFFLIDEISLADDSVLERLNSVLEPERTLLLTEKLGDGDEACVVADPSFRILATMNPGGDFGKKELSPALRNRFTEIWCPSDIQQMDLVDIIEHNILEGLCLRSSLGSDSGYGLAMTEFLNWFLSSEYGRKFTVSLRDILAWVDFINQTAAEDVVYPLSPAEAYIHGACLVYLDSLGSGPSACGNKEMVQEFTNKCLQYLVKQVHNLSGIDVELASSGLLCHPSEAMSSLEIQYHPQFFSIGPFIISCDNGRRSGNFEDPLNDTFALPETTTGPGSIADLSESYTLESATPKANLLRIVRALQVTKPILLEGSPGVGKTSLVAAIAKSSGHEVVRINLSEQTDITDLFGADLPVEGGASGEFAWRDGPLLQALREGHWILLDELNLASQSVLEGLNACLDHRGEIYIPELGTTFHLEYKANRIFGCQNPYKDGSARKGLPRSFLNRFTQVYVDPLTSADLEFIASSMYSKIPKDVIAKMVTFNEKVVKAVCEDRLFGLKGSPWEFNLRDIFRWCEAIVQNQDPDDINPGEYVKLIYCDRMRTSEDKDKICEIYQSLFGKNYPIPTRYLELNVFAGCVQLGYSFLPRLGKSNLPGERLYPLHFQLSALESLMKCLEMNWMAILVGPSGSGKSSIVRYVAALTGHTVHVLPVNSEMDTTELLGGFEQADLNRHIDYLAQDIEELVSQVMVTCLTRKDDEELAKLEEILLNLATFRKLHQNKEFLSTVEEVEAFQDQLDQLKKIMNDFDEFPLSEEFTSALNDCMQAHEELHKKLNASGVVSSGGKFEWVDSILVRAVKKGHWLLIDDVNFCSPSVLDRLNGLLEPDGVLTLSEQGVVGDELVTIKPHPSFRIIFAMDPKNGEISRAMRNRGVEINILCEGLCLQSEHEGPDTWDAVTLILSRGLTQAEMVECLLRIHHSLEMRIGNVSFCDLLSAASLTVQNLQKHVDPMKALWHSCQSVYVRSILNNADRKKAEQVVLDYLKGINVIRSDLELCTIPLLKLFPSCLDYQISSSSASVRQSCALFTYLLHQLSAFVADQPKFGDYTPFLRDLIPCPLRVFLHPGHVEEWIRLLITVIRITVESSSYNNQNLLLIWMRSMLEVFEGDGYLCTLGGLCGMFMTNVLTAIQDYPVVQELLDTSRACIEEINYYELSEDEMPLDLRWNPCMLSKLKKILKSCDKWQNMDQLMEHLVSCANRSHLLMMLLAFQYVEVESRFQQQSQNTLLKVSKAFSDSLIGPENLPHPVIAKIYPFFASFYAALTEFLKQKNCPCPNELYWQILEALYFYYSAVRICNVPYDSQTLENQISLFTVHWNSVMKKVLSLFAGENMDLSLFSEVRALAHHISRDLGLDFSEDLKLRSKLVKFVGQTLAIPSEEAAKVYESITNVAPFVSIPAVMKSSQKTYDHMKLIISQEGTLTRRLSEAFYLCLDKKSTQDRLLAANNAVHLMELQLNEAGLLQVCGDDDDEDVMEVCDEPLTVTQIPPSHMAVHFQMLPLWDYLFVLTESSVLASAMNIMSKNLHGEAKNSLPLLDLKSSQMNFLIEIGSDKLCLDPAHMGILLSVKGGNLKNVLPELIMSFFNHARNGASSGILLHCLHASEEILAQNDSKSGSHLDITWADQVPLLTYICQIILHGSNVQGNAGTSLSLGMCVEKSKQIESVKRLLWKNGEFLADNKCFRNTAVAVATYWFENLISGMASVADIPVPQIEKLEEDMLVLSNEVGLSSRMMLSSDANILFETAKCLQDLKALYSDDTKSHIIQWLTGKYLALVGLLTTFIFAPVDCIDPVKKSEAKSECCHFELHEVKRELELRVWQCMSLTGQSLQSHDPSDLHPHVAGLPDRMMFLNAKLERLRSNCGYRPQNSQFLHLRSMAQNYLQSVGSPRDVYETIIKLERLKEQMESQNYDENELSKCVAEIATWSKSQVTFIHEIQDKFFLYRDLAMPFLAGIEQMVTGIQMMTQTLSVLKVHCSVLLVSHPSIESFLTQMSSFPTMTEHGIFLDPLEIAAFLSEDDTVSTVSNLCSFNKPDVDTQKIVFNLMRCSMLEMKNETAVFSKLSHTKLLTYANSALKVFYDTWVKQEEELKLKQEQDESLYEYKVHSHESDMLDEEAVQHDLSSMFPSYKEDFAEFIPVNLEDTTEVPTHNGNKSTGVEPSLSSADMLEVWSLHASLIFSLSDSSHSSATSECSHIIIKPLSSPDYATSFLLRYEILKEVILAVGDNLGNILDKKLIGAHLLACSATKQMVDPSNDNQWSLGKYYDIYHDPNPSEALQCRPLLENLVYRVNSLLQQFPDNPLLKNVLNITRRILSFPVVSPLVKFVTGMELLLAAAQDWEQNAHSGVSLQQELSEITNKILYCRKLELSCWRQCLDSVMKKQYLNCSKLWFHVFSILSDFLDENKHWSDGFIQEWEESKKDDIIKALQQLMEDSTIGEFGARLDLIHTSLLHAKMSKPSTPQKKITTVLHNIYSYYAQFLPAIAKKITDVRTPIEKEVKEFVKIARWNDANFWSVKQAVEKSHRTIHKHIKSFEKELQQHALKFFDIPSRKDSGESEQTPWSLDIDVTLFASNLDLQNFPSVPNSASTRGSLITKTPRLYQRMSKFCRTMLKTSSLVLDINQLNEFAGEVIERTQELESLDVTKGSDKTKQKAEARQIHHQKRQALASLLKTLSQFGLSYRQGLIYSKNRDVNGPLCAPPLDVKSLELCGKSNLTSSSVVRCVNDTNHYYYKCVAQHALLMKSLENPSKELSMDIIHKCEGFSGHLMQLIVTQRYSLAAEMKNIIQFKNKVNSLLLVFAEKHSDTSQSSPVPPQKFVVQQREILCDLLIHTVTSLQQFLVLMECCPLPSKDPVPCMIDEKFRSTLSMASKRDNLWSDTVSQAQECLEMAKSVISAMLPELDSKMVLCTWEQFESISESFNILDVLSKKILALKNSVCNDGRTTYLTECLQSVNDVIQKETARFQKESVKFTGNATFNEKGDGSATCEENEMILKLSEKLLKVVLLGMQDALHLNGETRANTSEDCKLITDKIDKFLSEMGTEALHIKQVEKCAKHLMKCVVGTAEKPHVATRNLKYVGAIIPVLHQYSQLLEYYAITALGMHRTSCKTLSVLLGLFTTLAEKGFCLPPELEAEKGNATEFHDIQEGGLGDGEGLKDVSENIKSEDQLEDAMKEGENKKEEESESPDVKEENGIEMSEDFDGKLHDPDTKSLESNDEEDDDDDDTELDKKMGDVTSDLSENINEQLWGSDEDEDDELRDVDAGDGVTKNEASEVVAKDEKQKEDHQERLEDTKDPEELASDAKNEEEYDGEHPDPMIDKQPEHEPEAADLPEEIQLDKDGDESGEDEEAQDKLDIDDVKESENEKQAEEDIHMEVMDDNKNGEAESEDPMELEDGTEQKDGEKVPDPSSGKEEEEIVEEQPEETEKTATTSQSNEAEAVPAEDASKHSKDAVQYSEEAMEWDGGSQKASEQHQEGQADSEHSHSHDTGHKGKQVSSSHTASDDQEDQQQQLKPSDENRSLSSAPDKPVEKVPVTEKNKSGKVEDSSSENKSHEYQHVTDVEKGDTQTMDIATEEQASEQTLPPQQTYVDDDDDDVIALDDSDDDIHEEAPTKVTGQILDKKDNGKNTENVGSEDSDMSKEIPGVPVATHGASRGPDSTIHTQHDLWSSMSVPGVENVRRELVQHLDLWCRSVREGAPVDTHAAQEIWHQYEDVIAPLVQELCEQLRLVLEPTKMTKLKGDYRTGKRLNMRKIIPYIASQFRKDKIWLRRTKPSKRQYQIMLAVDDSSSMANNQSRQLAFESLALIGKSLSLLEAGDLAIVSFGENVRLHHSFSERFTDQAGAHILQEFTFAQKKTGIAKLLEYATSAMVKARNGTQSRLISKEIAQLLLIISDGRGLFNEGEEPVRLAVRRARDNNIFMVFIIVDNPNNKDSILDIKSTVFDSQGQLVELKPYIEKFPFPFYILLREISSLPLVLGEALRQWFELVTSVER